MLKAVGEETCSTCGSVYKLYETPRGIMGACKTCVDNEFIKSLKLPSIEDLKQKRLEIFVTEFEKVTSDIERASVSSYKPRHETQLKAKQIAVKYVKEFDGKKSIVLSGDPGLGKSHLAYAIVKAVRQKGYNALYIKSTYLLDKLKKSYSGDKYSEEQIFHMIERLDLLAVDDIGAEYVKSNDDGHESWASDVLYKIFDMRIEKAIICTTNYSESELNKKYGNNGPRIISRMTANAHAIRLEGQDYRREEAF